MEIIEINGLNKSFGDLKAVDNLSFKVKKGEMFAFLGVNGAGKSTTINIMCGQLSKDSGFISVCGYDIDKDVDLIKSKIGVVFQDGVLDASLTVKENLESRACLYGITGNEFKKVMNRLVPLLDLDPLLDRPLGKLSGGQKRRIDIARALLHSPEILILDEPTTGLDPQTRKSIWSVISTLRRENNMTVFLTTHYMEEAAEADYVVILDSGKIVAEGTPLSLKNEYTGDFVSVYGVSEADILSLGLNYVPINDGFRVNVPNTKVAAELIRNYPEIFNDFEIVKGKMDDVFLAVTGKNL